MCLLVSTSQAVVDFNVPSGDWFVASNWYPAGVPTFGDAASINGGRVASIASGNAMANQVYLGHGTDGTLNMSGGTLMTMPGGPDKSLWIGDGAGHGTLNMTGGEVICNNRWAIGGDWNEGGTATVNLSNDAKMSFVAGITASPIGYSKTSVVNINMSGTSVFEVTHLAPAYPHGYIDFRLGDITVNMSDDSRIYSSGNIRLGGTSALSAMGVNVFMTGGTLEMDAGFHAYNDSHVILSGDSEMFAAFLNIFDTCTIDISDDALLNVKDRTIEELEAMFGTQITGSGLAARTVTIEGVEYTQVYVPEPATLILLASGMLVLKRRRR
jgi:hypothetical protein